MYSSIGALENLALFHKTGHPQVVYSQYDERPFFSFAALITLRKHQTSLKQISNVSEDLLIEEFEQSHANGKACFIKCFSGAIHIKDKSLIDTKYEREVSYNKMKRVCEHPGHPLALLILVQVKLFETYYLTLNFYKTSEKKQFFQLLTRKIRSAFITKLDLESNEQRKIAGWKWRRFSTNNQKEMVPIKEEKYKRRFVQSFSAGSRSEYYKNKSEESRKNSIADSDECLFEISESAIQINEKSMGKKSKKILNLFSKEKNKRRNSSTSSGIETDAESIIKRNLEERKISKKSSTLETVDIGCQTEIDRPKLLLISPHESRMENEWIVTECRINTDLSGNHKICEDGSHYMFCASTSKFFKTYSQE